MMDLKRLSPIEIAAIASAGLAVLLILLVVFHAIVRRLLRVCRRGSHHDSRTFRHDLPSATTSHGSSRRLVSRSQNGREGSQGAGGGYEGDRRGSYVTWGYGGPLSSIPDHGTSPSTGQTTLVTPVSAKTGHVKLKKGLWGWGRRGKEEMSDQGSRGKLVEEGRSPMFLRPESEEMVVVTYEEGLAKLGLSQPHHILSMSSQPPPFEEARQAYPTVSPRITPNRHISRRSSDGDRNALGLSLVRNNGGPAQHTTTTVPGGRERHRASSLNDRNDRIRHWVRQTPEDDLPSAVTRDSNATRPEFACVESGDRQRTKRDTDRTGLRLGAGSGVARSTWLPIFYETSDDRGDEWESDSQLNERAGHVGHESPGAFGRGRG